MPKRKYREKVSRVARLTSSPWSPWYTAMVPKQFKNNPEGYKPRAKGHYGFVYKDIEEQFTEYDNGIYEISASPSQAKGQKAKKTKKIVVYIGKTGSQYSDSLNKRIRSYCTSGSHEKKAINRALEKGYTLYFRVKNIPEDAVEKCELKYLRKYDYAWNKINNGEERENVPP